MLKMKNPTIILILVLSYIVVSCSSPNSAEKASLDENPSKSTEMPTLEGSWKLVKFKEIGDTIYTTWPQDINPKIKLVTDKHFTWISYDDQSVISSGGGTYAYNGENYIENIDFFKKPNLEDADLTGTSVHFNCKLVGDKWYHSGYAKEYELDPESLTYIAIDSFWIEEIWEKM